jgi:hypothetical protein
MTVTLPPELTWFMEKLGFNFPDTDETKLLAIGKSWNDFATTMEGLLAQADQYARSVKNDNEGESITAFWAAWSGSTGPANALRSDIEAARILAATMAVAAGIVLALKGKVIGEVTLFARACWVAAAAAKTPVTAILAVAGIVFVRLAVVMAINAAFEAAIQALLGE